MNDFIKCIIKIATAFWVAAIVILLVAAVLLLLAPDVFLKALRYGIAILCLVGAGCIVVPLLRVYFQRTK